MTIFLAFMYHAVLITLTELKVFGLYRNFLIRAQPQNVSSRSNENLEFIKSVEFFFWSSSAALRISEHGESFPIS